MTLSRKDRSGYPFKKTINLAMKEKNPLRLAVAIPMVILVLALVALFSKFAVFDRIERMNAAEAAVAKLQSEKNALDTYLLDYDDVDTEYKRYSTKWMTDEESGTVPRMDMLAMIEQEFMKDYRVLDISVNGNVVSMKIAGISLEDMSGVVTSLYSRDDVENVEISTASNTEKYTVKIDNKVSETVTEEIVSIIVTMKQTEGGTK